jgi:hypothetical protein
MSTKPSSDGRRDKDSLVLDNPLLGGHAHVPGSASRPAGSHPGDIHYDVRHNLVRARCAGTGRRARLRSVGGHYLGHTRCTAASNPSGPRPRPGPRAPRRGGPSCWPQARRWHDCLHRWPLSLATATTRAMRVAPRWSRMTPSSADMPTSPPSSAIPPAPSPATACGGLSNMRDTADGIAGELRRGRCATFCAARREKDKQCSAESVTPRRS